MDEKTEKEAVDTLINKMVEDAGFGDWFFCGVTLSGRNVTRYAWGHDGTDTSNQDRLRQLLGTVEGLKWELIRGATVVPDDDETHPIP